MIYARQSTAIIVTVGPVLDADGVAVTDGVVGDFKISKNGGAPAALNGSATLTHRNTGHYSLSLTTSDVGTVGTAEIVIDDTVNACPIKEIQVVEEAVYDALFAASAPGYVANAPVNVAQINAVSTSAVTTIKAVQGLAVDGVITTLTNLPAITANWLTAAGIAASAMNGKGDWNIGKTGYALSAAGVQAIWDALTSALTTVGSIGKLLVDNINATISSRSSHSAADVWAAATRRLSDATNITSTGGTTVPQTGDSFARLGAPAGASVSADVAAVKTDTGNLVTRITSSLFTGITSLAQWLGLLAGKQTGDTTARTELRATGAGSGTFVETTDSLEALRDRGDAAWTTATGFSTHTAADVWAVGSRTLTAGTNIQLPSNGLALVTSWTVAITGDITGNVSGSVGSIATGGISAASFAAGAIDSSALSSNVVTDVWMGTALTESYRSANATGTPAQLLYEILQNITEFAISGTTKTVKKLDGSTTAKTYTLDSATTPTSITETT